LLTVYKSELFKVQITGGLILQHRKRLEGKGESRDVVVNIVLVRISKSRLIAL